MAFWGSSSGICFLISYTKAPTLRLSGTNARPYRNFLRDQEFSLSTRRNIRVWCFLNDDLGLWGNKLWRHTGTRSGYFKRIFWATSTRRSEIVRMNPGALVRTKGEFGLEAIRNVWRHGCLYSLKFSFKTPYSLPGPVRLMFLQQIAAYGLMPIPEGLMFTVYTLTVRWKHPSGGTSRSEKNPCQSTSGRFKQKRRKHCAASCGYNSNSCYLGDGMCWTSRIDFRH